jgi:aspartate aminotransferase
MFESFEILAFNNDHNPNKIDLGAGVYKDEEGITPVFAAVKQAESQKFKLEKSKTYTGIDGDPLFCEKIQPLVLGEQHPAIQESRTCAIAAPGGSGALRVAGEVINSWKPGTKLWISNPSWPNHSPLLGTAGLTIEEYPYYDVTNHTLLIDAMMDHIAKLGKDDVLLVHGCCHNPSGADLNLEHWKEITRLAQHNGFIPFVDFAYQGLGKGLDIDAQGPRHLAASVPEVIIAYSCSKNFGLYRERVGSSIIVSAKPDHAIAARSHMKSVARRLYSVPPAHGAILVGMILDDSSLRQNWEAELDSMQQRINALRKLFSSMMQSKGSNKDFSFIEHQNGMFSILGLSQEQVHRLRSEFSIYMVTNSRINIAGVSPDNVEYLTDSILAVI